MDFYAIGKFPDETSEARHGMMRTISVPTLKNSATIKTPPFLILTLVDSDTFQIRHYLILTLKF